MNAAQETTPIYDAVVEDLDLDPGVKLDAMPVPSFADAE